MKLFVVLVGCWAALVAAVEPKREPDTGTPENKEVINKWIQTRMVPTETNSIKYETAYGCEGNVMKFECEAGKVIKLIRANYGRLSSIICNDRGHRGWSVNCMSSKALRILHNQCNLQSNCSIAVNNRALEGDPCYNTYKYLEVDFTCDEDNNAEYSSSQLFNHVPQIGGSVVRCGRNPHEACKGRCTKSNLVSQSYCEENGRVCCRD